MHRNQSDADVIACSLNEPEAFAAIFDRHQGSVYNFLRRRVGSDIADEWLGETFTQAFRARARYVSQHDTCRPWLLGIASHLIANHRRSEHRRLAAMRREAARGATEAFAGADEIAARIDARSASAALVDGLRELDPRDRDVLLLYAWADLRYGEIAEALDIPAGTVRSRLHRARAAIRERLAQPGEHDEALIASSGEQHG